MSCGAYLRRRNARRPSETASEPTRVRVDAPPAEGVRGDSFPTMGGAEEPEGGRFTRLTRRARTTMKSEEAVLHQRRRIMDATTELVVKRGFAGVSVEQIVSLAGVSKTAFYREFEGRAGAFEVAALWALEEGTESVRSFLQADDNRGLEEALALVAAMIAREETAARLVFVAPVETEAAVGARVREKIELHHRAGLAEALEVEGLPEVSDVQLCGLAGGIDEVVYRRLHAGEPEALATDMPLLAGWVLDQAEALAGGPSVGDRLLAELGKPEPGEDPAGSDPTWDWRSDLHDPEVRGRLGHRERIIGATGQLVLADGYAGLSVARISSVSGTSNQTFYEHFANKEEAFLAAFDELSLRAFRVTAAAVAGESDPLRGAVRGLVAMLDHIAHDPIHQRLVFVELAGAGPGPLARAEAMLDLFVGFLEPARLPAEAQRLPPRTVREAIGGGIWAIVRQEIQAGRGDRLADRAAAIVDFAVLAFGVR
jgi:AcrR family transcriptional regulator